jgi:hypothetical protein
VLSTMTSSQAVERAERRRGELHCDGADPRIPQGIAARGQLNAVRLAMTLPRRPVRGGDVHARALERLDVAVDDFQHSSEESHGAQGRFDKRSAALALAAANEQLAAREAWLKYIEHGY